MKVEVTGRVTTMGPPPLLPPSAMENHVKVFWVEPLRKWRVTYWQGDVRVDAGIVEDFEAKWRELTAQGLGHDGKGASPLYRLPDGREVPSEDLPPGAMFDAEYMHGSHLGEHLLQGADGISLVVVCPDGHHWMVDNESSNCSRKREAHCCWCRHGDPHTGDVHVDKDGNTCSAGAGSIQTGKWHGFLHHGYLDGA